MPDPVVPLPPAEGPAECANWLPREELTVRAALAYEMARLDCFPESGGFMQDGAPYSDRETFMSCLLDNLALLIGDYARAVGAAVPSTHDPERLALLADGYRRRRLQEVSA